MNTSLTNNSADIEEEVDFADTLLYYEFILLSVILTIICALAIGGNLLVMLSFMLDKKLRTLSNYFLLSLAVSDIMIATFSMPLFTAYLLIGEWPFGTVLCDMWLAQDYMCSNASEFNLLMIGFDRYFSVTSPLRYRARRTGKHVAYMISCVWVLSFLIWPPWIYSWQYIEGKRTVPEDECYVQFVHNNVYLAVITSVITYYTPVTILCILYYMIWRETVKRKNNLASMKADQETSASLPEIFSNKSNVTFRRSKLFSCCSSGFWTLKKPCCHKTVENIELSSLTSDNPQTSDKITPEGINTYYPSVNNSCQDVKNIDMKHEAILYTDTSNEKDHVTENVPLKDSSINKSSEKQDNKAAKMLTAILLSYIICATPYNVVIIVKSFNAFLVSEGMWVFCYFMCYVNSALNPICYALASENFRKTYWEILKCSWSSKSTFTSSFSNSVETASQSRTSQC